MIFMDIDKAREILSEMILFTYHTRLLEFALILGSLDAGLLGLLTTLLKRFFLRFTIIFIFTS